MANNSELEKTAQEREKKQGLAPIAKPLAEGRLSIQTYQLVRLAAVSYCLHKGVKGVLKCILRGGKGLCVFGGNVSPIDVMTHVPVLCEEHDIPYIYVSSTEDLGNAAAMKTPTCCVLVQTKPVKRRPIDPEFQKELKVLKLRYEQVVPQVKQLLDDLIK